MSGRPENYFIKDGYRVRKDSYFFDDTPFKDEWQDAVYKHAFTTANFLGYQDVIDVGCGSGYKLMKYFRDRNTLGIDLPRTVDWLRQTYPDRRWEYFDPTKKAGCDLVICSDVIEHVQNPDQLLDHITALGPKTVVLSTPERDLLKLGTEDGPPKNAHHVREWNFEELGAYISSRFEIVNHFIADAAGCQVVECQPRR